MSMYGEDNIPRWRKMGLSEYEIHHLIHKPPYSVEIADRDLTEEKPLIDYWINIGLNDSEIARLLKMSGYKANDRIRGFGYKYNNGKFEK